MDEKSLNLWRQIERCRRLASVVTDDEVRRSLEHLAEDYETKCRKLRDASFMLQPGDEGGDPPIPHSNR